MRKPTMTVMPMTTDDERQSVANALRRLATKYDGIVSVILENQLGLESDDRFVYGSVFTFVFAVDAPSSSEHVSAR